MTDKNSMFLTNDNLDVFVTLRVKIDINFIMTIIIFFDLFYSVKKYIILFILFL